MPDRVAALLTASDRRLLTVRHRRQDGTEYRTLPGGAMRESDPTHEDALRRVLRGRLKGEVVVGPLVHVARTGAQDEYVFCVWTEDGELPDSGGDDTEPAAGAFAWDHIVYDKSAIYAAGLVPHELTYFLAGHCHYGHDPRELPDVRSRPPSVRRHDGREA